MTRLIPGRDRSPSSPSESADRLAFAGALAAVLSRRGPDAYPSVSVDPIPVDPGPVHPGLVDPPPVDPPPVDPSPVDPPPVDATAEAVPEGHADPVLLLWAAYRRCPDRSARDRLVEHYRPLVHAVARRAAERLPSHVEPSDLVQSGVFGLLKAIERYDPGRCPRFESYAALRIRGAVLDELRAQDWVPRSVRLRAREAARAREQLTVRLRRTATEREVAAALGLTPGDLHASAATRLVSVEALQESADGPGLGVLPDGAPDPAAVAEDREARRQLRAAVAQLGDRDRLLVHLYYVENRTLAEIGRLLGVTESRVCQLHSRLVGRLRGLLDGLAAG